MARGKKAFFIFGIPFFVFTILFSIILFINNFLYILTIGLIGSAIFLFRRMKRHQYPYIRLLKISFVLFCVSFGIFCGLYNPKVWASQFPRNLNKASLIEPNNYAIENLETNFFEWIDSKPYLEDIYGLNYTSAIIPFQYADSYYIFRTVNFSETDWDSLDSLTKLLVINYFITNEVIEWTEDSEVYGSLEYKGTVDEVLAISLESNWTKKSKDDCDGIAVVTVSFLQRLGYNAYIGSGKGHWYTVVEPRSQDNFNTPLFLNTWRSIHVYFYFNQYEFKIGQPLLDTFKDVWFLDEADPEVIEVIQLFSQNYLIAIFSSIVLGLVGVLFVCFPRKLPENILREKKDAIQKRKEKILTNKIIGKKYNPLYWLIRITYIQIGNPFKKMYIYYWIDVIWTSISAFFVIIGLKFIPLYWLNSYFAITLTFILVLLESQFSSKIFDGLVNLIGRKSRKIEAAE
ncbi:MAG: hypothetical protein ACTSRZ_14620 [Promethearchaeota archaeon]